MRKDTYTCVTASTSTALSSESASYSAVILVMLTNIMSKDAAVKQRLVASCSSMERLVFNTPVVETLLRAHCAVTLSRFL